MGFAPQPEVVSDSPHFVETQRSFSGLLAAQLARPLQVFARRLGRPHDGVVVAVLLDAEMKPACWRGCRRPPSSPNHPRCRSRPRRRRSGWSRCRSACGNGDPDRRRTAAAVRVRQRHRALDVVLHRLRGGVRQVVDRQDDDVVAHADAAVFALVTPESSLERFMSTNASFSRYAHADARPCGSAAPLSRCRRRT